MIATSCGRLVVRRAHPEDAVSAYDIAMDPAVRANSTQSDPFSRESHERWWAARLADPESWLGVAEVGGLLIGVVRYQLSGDDAEVGISIVPGHRGHGHAAEMLRASERAGKALGARRLVALVLGPNEPSARAFLAAGYAEAGEEVRDGRSHRRFEKVNG